jgi:positive regulator of sigma E activity
MLVVNVTDYVIYWASAPQTTTFGICLFYILVFAVFEFAARTRNQTPWFIVLLILLPAMVMAHAVSSFIFLITLFGLLLGSYLYVKVFGNRLPLVISVAVFTAYGIFLIQHWFDAVFTENSQDSFFSVMATTLNTYVTEHAGVLNRPETIATYAATLPPLIERVANTAGIALLMLFAAIGSLHWISKKEMNRYTFSMIICSIVLMIITFGFPLFGIRNILPTRWFAFIYLFLSVMAGYAIFTLGSSVRKPAVRMSAIFILIVPLVFFMVGNTICNLDSPLWLENSTISTSYTVPEVLGGSTITNLSSSTTGDQNYQISILNAYYRGTALSSATYSSSRNLGADGRDLFIWRNYMENRPIQITTTVEGYYQPVAAEKVLGEEYYRTLLLNDKVYNNGDLTGFWMNA